MELQIFQAEVTEEEIRESIKITKKGSAPGPDGIPAEFYQAFPQLFGQIFKQLYKEICVKGRIPKSMTESFITLIPKKDRDPNYTKNWRLISLLNADYKILTKLWAQRLRPVVMETIGRHQTGFIPERDIRENVLLVQTIIDRMYEKNKRGGILFLDWEKAYDRISHEAIYKVAERLGFPQHGLRFLQAMYQNATGRVLCNNFQSETIRLKSGVRQGCPLSPLLFVLVAEILCQNLIKAQYSGFKINDSIRVKVVSYADDTAIPVAGKSEFIEVIRILKRYQRATGSLINTIKTKFLAIRNRSSINKLIDKLFEVYTPGQLIQYLGFPVGVQPDYTQAWKKVITKVHNALLMWDKICSSIYGRSLIIKVKALACIWYMASILPLDQQAQQAIKNIQKQCMDFFWSYRMHKLRFANLTLTYKEGGHKLWFVQEKIKSLQLKWMIKFENPDYKALWKDNAAEIFFQVQDQ